jgi:hypothetical protein
VRDPNFRFYCLDFYQRHRSVKNHELKHFNFRLSTDLCTGNVGNLWGRVSLFIGAGRYSGARRPHLKYLVRACFPPPLTAAKIRADYFNASQPAGIAIAEYMPTQG